MKITVTNEKIKIENITQELKSSLMETLVFKDKSKEYQIKRMSRNPWSRNSTLINQLKSQVNGYLYTENADGSFDIPSTFFHLIKMESGINDLRKGTGKVVSLPWVKKPYDLRPYQDEAVSLMENEYRGIINLATGLGKTLLAIHAIRRIKKKALIVCPGESVALQFYDQLVDAFGKSKVGYVGGGKKKLADITVGIAASVVRNVDLLKAHDLGLVIVDETHHTPANTFYDVALGLAGVGKIFGLTATDYRSDGKDILITAGCGPVLIRRDIKWGVDNKFLAEPHFLIRKVSTGGKDYKDDKLKSYKEHVLNNAAMKAKIEGDARSMMATGKVVLILVDQIAHGKELAQNLGIPFATGEDKDSQEYISQLNNGKIKALVATDGIAGEGTDTKTVEVLILCNFVASKGAVIQAVGRALRKQGTKEKALIIDYWPVDSTMLSRHAARRIEYYSEITSSVKVL